MTAPFNPYQHWLGYTGAERPRTFYELLGLKHHEKNIQRIAKTADELLAKVRSLPPGDHFLEWEQLTTEIQVAKNCLCNPKYKEEYDASHPAPPTPQAPPVQAAPQATPGAVFPPNMAMPFAPTATASPTANPFSQTPPPGVLPSSPQGIPPAGVLPGQPMPMGMPPAPGAVPQYPSAVPAAGYPVNYPGMVQPGVPVQQGMYVSPAGMVQPAVAPNVPPGMPSGSVPQQSPYGVFGQQPSPSPGMPVNISQPTGNTTYGNSYSASGKSAYHANKKNSKDTQNTAMQRNIVAVVGLCIVAVLGWLLYGKMNQPQEIRTEIVESTPELPANPVSPLSPPPALPSPQPGKSTADDFAQKSPAAEKFQEIRDDLARQDIEQARVHLQEAQTLCKKDSERQELNRLANITDLIENFVKSIHQAMGKFEPTVAMNYYGEEFNISESEPGKLILFQQGQSKTYTSDSLYLYNDFDVVDFIVEKKLVKDVGCKIQYGAYLVMLPHGNHQLARELWDEVASQQDISLIYPELNRWPDSQQPAKLPVRLPSELMEVDLSQEKQETPSPEATASKNSQKKEEKTKKETPRKTEVAEKPRKATPTAAEKKQAEELKKLFQGIRQDISWREIANARKKIKQAEKLVQAEEDIATLERLNTLTDYMETFITWVANSMGRFSATDMVKINGEDVAIVESRSGHLIVRMRGVNRTYTTETLNPRLVKFLVEDQVKLAPDNAIIYGTYLAMDAEGDRQKARALWEEAQKKGKDTTLLMPELDIPLPDAGRKPASQEHPRATANKAEVQDVPPLKEREAALKSIQQEFARDYQKTDLRGKDLFTEKLLRNARSSNRTPAETYVLLQEACRIAQEVYRFETAYEAYMLMQQRFTQDTYLERFAMLTKANPAARGNISKQELCKCALFLSNDAISRKKKEDANILLNMAQKNGATPNQIRELRAAIAAMK
ncbi:MAG: hypothetical protein Q4D62_12790 [Planctomycetia bacterium]|nr:hypothetical protein [Planctomycetia bacterium]